MSPINPINSSIPLNLPEIISTPIPKFVEILETHDEDKIIEFIHLYGIDATSEKFYDGGYLKRLIHIAATQGWTKLIQLLIDGGEQFDIGAENENGMDPRATPFAFAVIKGHESSMELLLKHGANFNQPIPHLIHQETILGLQQQLEDLKIIIEPNEEEELKNMTLSENSIFSFTNNPEKYSLDLMVKHVPTIFLHALPRLLIRSMGAGDHLINYGEILIMISYKLTEKSQIYLLNLLFNANFPMTFDVLVWCISSKNLFLFENIHTLFKVEITEEILKMCFVSDNFLFLEKLIPLYKGEISETLLENCIDLQNHLLFDKILPLFKDKISENILKFCSSANYDSFFDKLIPLFKDNISLDILTFFISNNYGLFFDKLIPFVTIKNTRNILEFCISINSISFFEKIFPLFKGHIDIINDINETILDHCLLIQSCKTNTNEEQSNLEKIFNNIFSMAPNVKILSTNNLQNCYEMALRLEGGKNSNITKRILNQGEGFGEILILQKLLLLRYGSEITLNVDNRKVIFDGGYQSIIT